MRLFPSGVGSVDAKTGNGRDKTRFFTNVSACSKNDRLWNAGVSVGRWCIFWELYTTRRDTKLNVVLSKPKILDLHRYKVSIGEV